MRSSASRRAWEHAKSKEKDGEDVEGFKIKYKTCTQPSHWCWMPAQFSLFWKDSTKGYSDSRAFQSAKETYIKRLPTCGLIWNHWRDPKLCVCVCAWVCVCVCLLSEKYTSASFNVYDSHSKSLINRCLRCTTVPSLSTIERSNVEHKIRAPARASLFLHCRS